MIGVRLGGCRTPQRLTGGFSTVGFWRGTSRLSRGSAATADGVSTGCEPTRSLLEAYHVRARRAHSLLGLPSTQVPTRSATGSVSTFVFDFSPPILTPAGPHPVRLSPPPSVDPEPRRHGHGYYWRDPD